MKESNDVDESLEDPILSVDIDISDLDIQWNGEDGVLPGDAFPRRWCSIDRKDYLVVIGPNVPYREKIFSTLRWLDWRRTIVCDESDGLGLGQIYFQVPLPSLN